MPFQVVPDDRVVEHTGEVILAASSILFCQAIPEPLFVGWQSSSVLRISGRERSKRGDSVLDFP
jgi:hypothetical protein